MSLIQLPGVSVPQGQQAAFPVNIPTLNDSAGHFGLEALLLVFEYDAGIFDFPIGNEDATQFIDQGEIIPEDWQIVANSPQDGILCVYLAANYNPADPIIGKVGGNVLGVNFPLLQSTPPGDYSVNLINSFATSHTGISGVNGNYNRLKLGLPVESTITITEN